VEYTARQARTKCAIAPMRIRPCSGMREVATPTSKAAELALGRQRGSARSTFKSFVPLFAAVENLSRPWRGPFGWAAAITCFEVLGIHISAFRTPRAPKAGICGKDVRSGGECLERVLLH